ncbi:MAG: hypothetical protein L3K18_04320 [Thermoplasmata archaeon]|nr:hypothetical protein [Thermoplasmata archaeon]MCI4356353.1 hypothetical protein [Thermoplasmata archaeon]
MGVPPASEGAPAPGGPSDPVTHVQTIRSSAPGPARDLAKGGNVILFWGGPLA